MKQVTRERLEKAFKSLERYSEWLTGRDQRIMSKMMQYGFRRAIMDATGKEDPLFAQRISLELATEESNMLEARLAQNRWKQNIKRVRNRRKAIQDIQLHSNTSALMRGETKIGDGVIEYWEPRRDEFIITEDDLRLLKEDRDKIFQFWADHVALNRLNTFIHLDGRWESTTVEEIVPRLSLFGWANAWEDLRYLMVDHSSPVCNLDGDTIGYQYLSASSPKEGYDKHHEIHLILGSGIYWDDPEVSIWYCATNGDRPFD